MSTRNAGLEGHTIADLPLLAIGRTLDHLPRRLVAQNHRGLDDKVSDGPVLPVMHIYARVRNVSCGPS